MKVVVRYMDGRVYEDSLVKCTGCNRGVDAVPNDGEEPWHNICYALLHGEVNVWPETINP